MLLIETVDFSKHRVGRDFRYHLTDVKTEILKAKETCLMSHRYVRMETVGLSAFTLGVFLFQYSLSFSVSHFWYHANMDTLFNDKRNIN